ncbi:MAG TPA: CocE/NonD family hydrolase [candidate division Zixibacteria bacterium]|nr:CocE/NonD family hydrolase [candidate division Zixibacteria bacterium]
MQRSLRQAVIACVVVMFVAAAWAQPVETRSDYVRANYTKTEYRIPMRDGVKLYTAVYAPKDQSNPWPFLMNRTPYGVGFYGPDKMPPRLGVPELEKAGYIFVQQDVRGRYKSEGKFIEETPYIPNKKPGQIDETTDMYDTVEFLLKNVPNNNGRVGIQGISYPGFYTVASIIDSHPAIKAASPQAPMANLYMNDDAYHGGAFMLSANFGFYTFFRQQQTPIDRWEPPNFKYSTQNGYDFYLHNEPISKLSRVNNPLWDDNIKHPNYDSYWKVRDLVPNMHNVHCAVLTVGGLFDAEDLQGPFSIYHAIEKQNPNTVNTIVEGPWVHGGWAHYDGHWIGNVDFGSDTAEFFRKNILLPFFEHYLKDAPTQPLPEAYIFETGSNQWRSYDQWPPNQAQKRMLYLREGHGLAFSAPTESARITAPQSVADLSQDKAAFDEYVSDPAHPIPYVGYPVGTDVPQEYMASDQRFAATRGDVLVFETEPLAEDVTLAGPVSPRLFISSTGTDSDFIVKLIDVYPDREEEPIERRRKRDGNDVALPETIMAGYQQLVRGEPFRAKFRYSFEKPEPLTPGKIEEVAYTMSDVNHTFLKGHRIMVQIQSTWFPLVDLNPQTFVDVPSAKPGDFKTATERVYHDPAHASGIEVLVLPKQ